jgi:hypothetical protein
VEIVSDRRFKGSLSFMAAFFALSITAFPKDPQSGGTAWRLGHVSGYISEYSAAPLAMLLTWGL